VWVTAEPWITGPWFVAGAPDWITFTYPPLGLFGRGDGQTDFSVATNPSTLPRDGTVTFCSGQTMNVHQAGRSLRPGAYVAADFDDDGRADLGVYRPSTGEWFVLRSGSGHARADHLREQWGSSTDVPVPGDFDNDGRTDLAFYRPNGTFGGAVAGNWDIRYSSNAYDDSTATSYPWASSYRHTPQDTPLLADFSGDGRSDFVIYRPSNGIWSILFTGASFPGGGGPLGSVQFGWPGDIPVPADFDGDRRADIAVWRPSTGEWHISDSSASYTTHRVYPWGEVGDIPIVGDFDGDGKADLVTYRPAGGLWFINYSSFGYGHDPAWYQWGLPGDVPVANDYDGDGRTDLAVWRPSTGGWFIRDSSLSFTTWRVYQWGQPGDIPLGSRVNQAAPASFALNLTLLQGQNLSGPYAGTVTGPIGFTCSISWNQASVVCPRAAFANGAAVELRVVQTVAPGDGNIFPSNSRGCDAIRRLPDGADICTVNMYGDRDVIIGVGCSFCA
jgi:hypothetical protein